MEHASSATLMTACSMIEDSIAQGAPLDWRRTRSWIIDELRTRGVLGLRPRPPLLSSIQMQHHHDRQRVTLLARAPADRRLSDIAQRLDWVVARGLAELPDTLVASLHAAGIACERHSSPQALRRLLTDGAEAASTSSEDWPTGQVS